MIFFGDQSSSFEDLKLQHPDLSFKRLRQTHSDIVIQVDASSPELGDEGDALWTQDSNIALVLSTADCIPVMISDTDTGKVAAIHAGWRGVVNRIVFKTVQKVFSTSKSLEINLGPHISFDSFEVDFDVKNKLFKSTLKPKLTAFRQERSGKFHVNLSDLVIEQINEAFAGQIKIKKMSVDTKTNLKYFSHRREPQNKGRNFSFLSKD